MSSSGTIGIDAGGTLIKIVYEENNRLHYRKYPLTEMEPAMGWLKMFSLNKKIYLTGGKARKIQSLYYPNAALIDEFSATYEGTKFLMKLENISLNDKVLLVNIGTGTSWFIMDNTKSERVLGSGVGGGTLMGLGRLLSNGGEYSELAELAMEGKRANVDLLVKDIYEPDTPPIPGDLTASNFAKAALDRSASVSDQIASLINMISETITLLTVQAARENKIKRVVFIGSTVSGNKVLRDSLDAYAKMSGLDPVFLHNGEYSGAIGAKMFRNSFLEL
jgi:type II pantothenate kinase